jgi:hypothetical protein
MMYGHKNMDVKMKPVIIIAIAFVLLIPSFAFAQWNGDYPSTPENPECQSACYRLEHIDECPASGGELLQQCRIETAKVNPAEEPILDDELTYQPKCAEGDVLQDGVCIVTNPQPIYANENSWFNSIFDWLKRWFQ